MIEAEVEEKVDGPILDKDEEHNNKNESDVFQFLRSLKLDQYHQIFHANGADKLGQLIYIDEATIDRLCEAADMKIVHAGVFKKAIKECRITARMTSSSEPTEKAQYSLKFDQGQPHLPYNFPFHPPNPNSDPPMSAAERRRYMYNPDNGQYYGNHGGHTLHLVNSAQGNQDQVSYYSRAIQPLSEHRHTSSRYQYNREEIGPNESEQAECQNTISPKSSFHAISPVQMLPDGSYYVLIGDRSVKFPPSVRVLTIIEQINQDRRDIVRKGSQIYGRDDTKRKHNELTPLEVFMNEIAYEICLRDFTFMISRQRLLGLVREIVKDNQIQLSGHHSYSHNNSFNANTVNGKLKLDKIKSNPVFDNGMETITVNATEDNSTYSDYESILYHKVNREWPPGITKERRKYLGRRSSNFEAIDNVLYYSKDHRRRRWLHDDQEIKDMFYRCHVDQDTGCHFTREATIERISQNYYCKNMNEEMTKNYLLCDPCRAKFNLFANQTSSYATRNSKNHLTAEDVPSIPVVNSEVLHDIPPLGTLDSSGKRKLPQLGLPREPVPPAKKSRKSTPHKLVIESSTFNDIQNEAEDPSKNFPNGESFYDPNSEFTADNNSVENGSQASVNTSIKDIEDKDPKSTAFQEI